MKRLAPLLIAPLLMALWAGSAQAQTTEILACARDPSSEACLAIPGATREPPPQWSAGVSAGVAPRDGGPTGTYEALSLHRQLGRSYVQLGAVHYNTALEEGDVRVATNYGVGTIGFGGNYSGWVLDTYASYGRQSFGTVRYPDLSRATTGITGSPYFGAGASFGRIFAATPRLFLTPTASASYAWSRLLRPLPDYLGIPDISTSEPTWTTAGRLRLDWLPGPYAKSFIGVSAGVVWSNNATSQIYGLGGWGNTVVTNHLHDTWAEVGAHASLAVTRRLRVEATASRTLGLISGNSATVGIGLRRAF